MITELLNARLVHPLHEHRQYRSVENGRLDGHALLNAREAHQVVEWEELPPAAVGVFAAEVATDGTALEHDQAVVVLCCMQAW